MIRPTNSFIQIFRIQTEMNTIFPIFWNELKKPHFFKTKKTWVTKDLSG
jgi:hypothetical protein